MNRFLKIFIVACVLAALALLIKYPLASYIENDSMRILKNRILEEEKNLSEFYRNYNREDSLLWKDFDINMRFQYDVNMNIHKIEKAIDSNRMKDSVSLKVFNNIRILLDEFEENEPELIDQISLNKNVLKKMINDFMEYSGATDKRYKSFIDFHKHIFDEAEVSNHYLELFRIAEQNYFEVRKKYFNTYQSFSDGLQKISDTYKPY